MRKAITWIAGVLLFMGVSAVVVHYLVDAYHAPTVNVATPATPDPEVKKTPTKRVAVQAPVKVYADTAKFNLKLPATVAKNADEHVLSATQVRATERPQTVTTVIDEKTGDTQTFVKTDPYPWIALEHRGEVRMSYGYRYSAQTHQLTNVGRLAVTYDAIRVKALTGGVTAQIDTDGQAFVGVGIAYRF